MLEYLEQGAYRLTRVQWVPQPLEAVFPFFERPENLERITPSFLHFKILTPSPIPMAVGTRIDYRIALHGLPMRWQSEITAYESGVRFVDEQRRGPYAFWRHEHTFLRKDRGTELRDVVTYRLPFGAIGRLAHTCFVGRDVARIFEHRAKVIASLAVSPTGFGAPPER